MSMVIADRTDAQVARLRPIEGDHLAHQIGRELRDRPQRGACFEPRRGDARASLASECDRDLPLGVRAEGDREAPESHAHVGRVSRVAGLADRPRGREHAEDREDDRAASQHHASTVEERPERPLEQQGVDVGSRGTGAPTHRAAQRGLEPERERCLRPRSLHRAPSDLQDLVGLERDQLDRGRAIRDRLRDRARGARLLVGLGAYRPHRRREQRPQRDLSVPHVDVGLGGGGVETRDDLRAPSLECEFAGRASEWEHDAAFHSGGELGRGGGHVGGRRELGRFGFAQQQARESPVVGGEGGATRGQPRMRLRTVQRKIHSSRLLVQVEPENRRCRRRCDPKNGAPSRS